MPKEEQPKKTPAAKQGGFFARLTKTYFIQAAKPARPIINKQETIRRKMRRLLNFKNAIRARKCEKCCYRCYPTVLITEYIE
jgi:hypothetical protein